LRGPAARPTHQVVIGQEAIFGALFDAK
jgi:hypothetical protein